MKVVTITENFSRGHGIATSISMLLRKIHESSPDIGLELICNETDGIGEEDFPSDIKLIVANKPRIFGYNHPATIWLVKYAENNPDTIIHGHNAIATWPLLFKKAKKLITWHGNNSPNWNSAEYGPLQKRLAIRLTLDLSTHMFRSLDKIVAVSDYLRNELINHYRIPSKKIERIYWGADAEKFSDSGEDQRYMLFVGRHVRYKNIGVLVELARCLNYPLICVGDGPERANLEEYAKKIGAPVKFKGKVPLQDLIRLYQNCSFYVTASKWEGFGLPPIEAGACGKPAIVPHNSAHVESVRDSVTGVVYETFNELCIAAKKLIDEPGKRFEMGRAARAHIVKNFNLNDTVAAYVDVYRRLISV